MATSRWLAFCSAGLSGVLVAGASLAARGETPRRTEIGAAPAWQGATREHIGRCVTEEQRRHAGCSANRMQWGFHHGLLGAANPARQDAAADAAVSSRATLTAIA